MSTGDIDAGAPSEPVVVPDVYCTVETIVDRRTIERNTLLHCQTWMIPYLAAIERKYGMDKETIPVPKSWRIEQQFDRKPQDIMPFVAVVSTGILPGRPPRRDGDGVMTAWWVVAIGAVCAARTDQEAKDLSGYYGAAIRLMMLQVPELGGWASGVEWTDERYDDWAPILEQMVSSVRLVFSIEVSDILNVNERYQDPWGTPKPPENPYADPVPFPDITWTEATIDLEKEPLGEE